MRRLLVAAAIPLMCACSRPGRAEPTPEPSVVTLSLLATNDVHGRLERIPVFAGHVEIVRKARRTDGGVLLVDAGDAFQGTIESNLNEGSAVVAAYNELGYHALALGNHEFDYGPEGTSAAAERPVDDPHGALKARVREARFPVLSANLIKKGSGLPSWTNLHRSTMTTIAGVRVGIAGGMTEEAEHVIKRSNFVGLAVTPLSTAIAAEAARLRSSGAEIVIAVTHAGGRCNSVDDPRDLSSCDDDSEIFRLARSLPRGAVDAIVGGHRDRMVAHYVAAIPVVHARSYLEAFSRIDLSFDRKSRRIVGTRIHPPHALCEGGQRSRDAQCQPGTYENQRVVPSAAVLSAVAPALDQARRVREERLGVRLDAAFTLDKQSECALGNLFVDLMRQAVPEADVAIANSGSLREELPAGDLTYGSLHRAMPFDNRLAKLQMTGAELARLLSSNVTQRDHGILSVSGVRARVACHDGSAATSLFHEDGRPVAEHEQLLVVTNDFVAMGGDGLLDVLHLPAARIDLDTGLAVRDALVAGMKRRPGILSVTDPMLFDPNKPRIQVPEPVPVSCR